MADLTDRTEGKRISWRKANRMGMLELSCVGLLFGFVLSHIGGTRGSDGVIAISFIVLGVACVLPIIAKK
jgi:hypothetical protein